MRIGQGYDVHRLVEGRDLIICGVKIPYEKGLLGHSDADVALHALADRQPCTVKRDSAYSRAKGLYRLQYRCDYCGAEAEDGAVYRKDASKYSGGFKY